MVEKAVKQDRKEKEMKTKTSIDASLTQDFRNKEEINSYTPYSVRQSKKCVDMNAPSQSFS